MPALLKQIRTDGFAAVDGDFMGGIAAVSAPVLNESGQLTAVFSVLGPSPLIDLRASGGSVKALLMETRRLSAPAPTKS